MQQLIAPDHAAFAVNCADAITIAVECEPFTSHVEHSQTTDYAFCRIANPGVRTRVLDVDDLDLLDEATHRTPLYGEKWTAEGMAPWSAVATLGSQHGRRVEVHFDVRDRVKRDVREFYFCPKCSSRTFGGGECLACGALEE